MFREKDREAYQRIKAPEELKNRIRQSVTQHRRMLVRQSTWAFGTAACLVVFIFAGSTAFGNRGILSVGDTVVSRQAVTLNEYAVHSPAVMSRERSVEPEVRIPLEIAVPKEAYISVSRGSLRKTAEDLSQSEDITEMELAEDTVVYWTVSAEVTEPPTCTITAGRKEYVYVMEYDRETAAFAIRQIK